MSALTPPLQTDKKTVTQDNQLISAIYKMTLTEKRLLMIAISRINPLSMPSEIKPFVITAEEWLETYPDSKHPYQEMQSASKALFKRHVFIKDRTHKKAINWVDSCCYYEGEARISLQFTQSITHYLCGYLEQFTSYNLLEVRALRSMHAIRLYENLVRFKDTGYRKWLLKDFRVLMTPDGSYKKFKALRQWVITPAVKEINAKTPINVTYEPVKQGRKIVAVEFWFKLKAAVGMKV